MSLAEASKFQKEARSGMVWPKDRMLYDHVHPACSAAQMVPVLEL
jgi:hypothetical protein